MNGRSKKEGKIAGTSGELGERVKCVQRGISQIVEEVTVKLIGAGLGDGVDLSTCRLAELRRVA